MLTEALKAELADYMERHWALRDEDGPSGRPTESCAASVGKTPKRRSNASPGTTAPSTQRPLSPCAGTRTACSVFSTSRPEYWRHFRNY